ncbi:MAG: RNA polymerase sigma factor [Dermatophilaceae bacterium]
MEPSTAVADLVAGARAGDDSCWNALVDLFLPLVRRCIGRFRLSAADASDVNQTVWLKLVEHLDDLREPRALPGWLATVARREALRLIEGRGRSLPTDPQSGAFETAADDADLDEVLVEEERRRELRIAIGELPDGRRELLCLLLADPPVPYEEISRRLGIPVGSIGPTRARALDQLRRSSRIQSLATTTACVDAAAVASGGGGHVAVG